MVPLSDKPVDEAVHFYLAHYAVVNEIFDTERACRIGGPRLLQLDAHARAG
ncbi:MAG: hypothetical protein ACXW5W_24000 [Candidatus Binatia bacterium]